jgi:peptide/nickel transport system permease protein
MSEAAANVLGQPERIATPTERPPPPARRSRAAVVISQTFAGAGPKLGLAWIVVIAFFGVFGPLVANSYPFLVKADGRVESPMLRYLNWADVALLVGTLLAIPFWFLARRFSGQLRLGIIAATFLALACVTFFVVRPPQLQAFDRYRELDRQGKIEWAIRAPIPFSPTDRLRDMPSFDPTGKPHPWPPSREHLLGTESNRSDIASRMIHACRIAMTLGFIATGLSTVIGIVIGAVTGYFAGWVDLIGQRVIEVFSAIPTLFLMLAAVAFFGRGLYMMMLIIGLTSWVGVARFVRAEFLRYRNVDFVQAARALGLPLPSILFRHLLPNALAPVLVEVSFGVAGAILSESGLSFLGLGLIDEPSWGALLNQAVGSTGGVQWWLAVFPGAAIFLTVMAYNLIGESLRDALDPKLLQRE